MCKFCSSVNSAVSEFSAIPLHWKLFSENIAFSKLNQCRLHTGLSWQIYINEKQEFENIAELWFTFSPLAYSVLNIWRLQEKEMLYGLPSITNRKYHQSELKFNNAQFSISRHYCSSRLFGFHFFQNSTSYSSSRQYVTINFAKNLSSIEISCLQDL